MLGILGMFLQAAAGHILYLALHLESGSFPRPLSPAEEARAFAALAQGDRSARDRLIRHNLRLVAHVAKKYYAAPDAQDDLISIGTIGLIKAVDTFDPARRIRFASYASQCVENAILSQCPPGRRGGWARKASKRWKVRVFRAAAAQSTGRGGRCAGCPARCI